MRNNILIFFISGIVYYLIEILFRGTSHIVMALIGGICILGVHYIDKLTPIFSITSKCVLGGFFITSVEFISGLILNVILKLHIWDYSNLPANIAGQICFSYFVLWIIASFPAILFTRWLDKKITTIEI